MNSRLLEILEQHVLPALESGAGALLPCAARQMEGSQSGGFQQAYTSEEFQHTHYEWFWLLEGESHMKIGDNIYRLQKGDQCFLPPQTWHCDVYNAQTPPYQSLWFVCSGNRVGINHFSYEPVGAWNVINYRAIATPPEFPALLTDLQREVQQSAPFAASIQRGLLLQMVGIVARRLQADEPTTKVDGYASVSQRVLGHLEKHYAQEISLRDIAQVVYLNPNYLTAVFKKETGQTIMEALTEIRLHHAKRLLLEDRLPVYEVAQAVGYENASYFSRVFHRHTGFSPGRYGKTS